MNLLEHIKAEVRKSLFGPPKPPPAPDPIGVFFEAVDRTMGSLEHMAKRVELDDVRARLDKLATGAELGKLLVRVETIEHRLWGKSDTTTYYCSFCGKSQHEVRKLIAGPTVFICDECVAFCTGIVEGENAST